MKLCLLFGLVLNFAGIAIGQQSKPENSWAVVVPWHGGGKPTRNCYIDASHLQPDKLTQFSVAKEMDKGGDSCIQYFYSASTTAANLANLQTQMQSQIDTLKAAVKTLSDLNDVLTKRLNEMEEKLNKSEPSK